MFNKLKRRFFLSVSVIFLITSCTTAVPAPPTAAQADTANWDQFVNQYIEDFFAAHPPFAVYQGRHEYDGLLPDWSKAGIEAEVARLKNQVETAKSFDDSSLTTEQQFQRDYLIAATDRHLFWMDKAKWPFRNPQYYFDWLLDSLDPSPYITLTYASLEQRMQAYTRYAQNVPTALAQIKANLQMPMPRTYLKLGIDSFGGYATYFRNDVPGVFAEVSDPQLQAEFKAANTRAADAMADLTAWLQSNMATATEDYALGADLYKQMLYDTERVEISLSELQAIGRADMQRNQQALAAACADFAPGASIENCFARMANRKPEGGAVAGARRQLSELKQFVIEQDLVTIPGKEEARVEESPPYARSNSAYINIPGPYEINQPSTYYISPPNPEWPPEVQNDYIPGESDLLFTSVHEVWPGHFLSFVKSNRAEFTFGRVFVTYAFGEGWAHYTEELMIEAGLRGASAETRIGQISNALLRNARFLSSIGLHTGGMTVAESEELFMTEAYQSKGTAEQQANRGTYDPGYLNYTMGKLMIRRLRADWVKTRGGRDAWRDFHDTFLSYGGPPVPMVRGKMLDTSPAAAFQTKIQTGYPGRGN